MRFEMKKVIKLSRDKGFMKLDEIEIEGWKKNKERRLELRKI